MKTGKKKSLIIFIVALIVCAVAAIYIGYTLYTRKNEEKKYTDLKDKVTIEELQKMEFTGERDGEAPANPDGVSSESGIDFEKLKSYNKELVAWIRVPGTNIDYPVARHESGDQTYYLNYNMYQEPAAAGCIYMENVNSADFSDNNTVLYGHNMKTKSMFGQIHKFEDETFFKEHQYIYIYIPGHKLTYQIFASYANDDSKLTRAYDFSDKTVYAKYIDNVLNMRSMGRNLRDGVKVTAKDKMITLSTCITNQPEKRYLVQGVLIKDAKTGKQ